MRRGVLAWVVLGVAVSECHGGPPPEERPMTPPGAVALVATKGAEDAQAVARVEAVEGGMPLLSLLYGDPRLAPVHDLEQSHDAPGAARAFDAVRGTVDRHDPRACEWDFLEGRLHLAAGDASEAAAAFGRVLDEDVSAPAPGVAHGPVAPAVPCALSPYAAFYATQALVRLGRNDEAIARAKTVGAETGAFEEAQLALADAYAAKGTRSAAVPIWRALLAAKPHGVRWEDSALALASALLDGADGAPDLRAAEAYDLATRVLVEAPALAERIDVAGVRARAWSNLPHRPTAAPPPLTLEEKSQQAQAWLDGKQPRRATELAEAVLKAIPHGAKEHKTGACKAATVRAQAKPRGKPEDLADAWGAAIARCDGDDGLVTALYYGGKASASAHRPSEALERFAKVEKLFPTHRLADDACFRAALVACDDGDEAHGLARLESLPDSYPDGDMGGEALFRVAIAKIGKGDLAAARETLDRIVTGGLDGVRDVAGRGAYFRARVSELSGDAEDAQRRYAAILGDHPLGYYMLLAYARLRAMSEPMARAAVASSVARESPGALVVGDHPELSSASFARFVSLLEVGEVDWARREAQAGGLVAEGVDPEVVWAVAWLYEQAGAPDVGHSFTRARLHDFREHWPAGRWRLAWEVAYPRVWDGVVARESEATRVPTPLTWAIMREESAFNPDAHSVADAIGLMQLIVPTARATARGTVLPSDEESLRRPEVSIALGTRLLSSLRASFPSDPALAIAAYNGGSAAVRRWLGERGGEDFDVFVERIPFEETRAYLKRVLSSEAAYAYLYEPKALDELFALPARP
jgi:soluble lytic murein transglycosylase